MKIAVYGATGMVGSQIVNESLSRGHEVTAVSRSGSAVDGASALSADLADQGAFSEIVEAHDTVVLATGPSRTGGDHAEWLDANFPEAYKAEALTMAAAYEAAKEAPDHVDWTVLAPAPLIQPGERTGEYVTALDTPAGPQISTQDFAVAMLDEIENPKHRRTRFTAAN